MAQGTITKLNRERGYGFIAVDGESAAVYFYRNSVEEHAFAVLKEGQRVEFVIMPDPVKTDRMRAERIGLVQ